MSFVKDDHKFTRGVGAIAAMDAVSSKRRRAAARAGVAMARRDGIMSRHTLGRISQTETSEGGGTGPSGSSSSGGSGGTYVPPRTPIPPRPTGTLPLPPKPLPPRLPVRIGLRPDAVLVKTPGSIVPTAPTPDGGSVIVVPPKGSTIVVGPPAPSAPTTRPPITPMPMPEFEETPDFSVVVDPVKAASSSSKYIVYGLIGLGALWFLKNRK